MTTQTTRRAKGKPSPPRIASLRDVDCWPTLGVDPGERWVGLCVRVGLAVVDACTVELPPASDPGADRVRVERLLSRMDALADRHEADARVAAQMRGVVLADGQSPWRVAVESATRPSAYLRGEKVPQRVNVYWSTAQALALYYAVLAAYPAAVIVAPDHHGKRHQASACGSGNALNYYPPELVRLRPHDFTDSDAQDRDHERAAFDVAGVANLDGGTP